MKASQLLAEKTIEKTLSQSVALIPARAGSKRIPHKNRAIILDKPLVCYSIDFALSFLPTERVFVSTDDLEIASISRDLGAQVIDRPSELASDKASSGGVVQHAADIISKLIHVEWIVLLQPTNPFRPANLIKDMLTLASGDGVQSVVAVSPLRQKIGLLGSDHRFHPVNYTFGQRSQDMTTQYFSENGLAYLTHLSLARKGYVVDDKPVAAPIYSWHGAIDIDEPVDLEIARAMAPRYIEEFQSYGF